jgi:PKD repeat protein
VVTDGCGNVDGATVSVIVSEPDNPVAVITNTTGQTSPIEITACAGCPFEIAFDGTSSTTSAPCDGLTYAWTIQHPSGADTTGTDPAIKYEFEEWGTHTVLLVVADGCGNTDSAMVSVIVSDCCITAAFSYTPPSPVLVGQVVQFDGSASSSDCGCGILTWSWNWGDGTPDGSGETTSHAYTTAGTYTVTLTVTDVCGNTANVTMDITVLTLVAKAEWTVMVYVGGDNNLDPAAWNDLGEMEAVGSTGQVKIVVQLDADAGTSCDGTYRYYVTGGVAPGASCPYYPADIVGVLSEQDMGDPSVMADFVNWTTTNYPADHYLLILWDHGGGWKEAPILRGVMQDDNSSSLMSMQELASGLSSCNEHIDIIGFDACLMGMIEVAYEIESSVMDAPDYMVASERSEWNDGWPYDDFLNHLTSNPLMSAATLGETIVHDYVNSGPTSATLSVVDLDNFSSIADPIFDAFRAALIVSSHQGAIATARVNAQLYPYTTNDIFKDIYDFAYRIYNNVADCTTEALDVMNFVDSVVLYEEWVGSDMQDSHGLSIFLTDSKTVGYDTNYDSLEFNVDTNWKSFLLSP